MLVDDILSSNQKKINIIGVPGAGKTQLVCDLACRDMKRSYLYLSFGRENTKNAQLRMPKNVFCASFHSLAKNKMNIGHHRIIARFTMSDANKGVAAHGRTLGSAKMLEAFVILCELFCNSGTPLSGVPQILLFKEKLFPALTPEEKNLLDMTFRSYWRWLWEDGNNASVTHDMYLKQYTLNASVLNVDCLIIDETQDLNASMFELITQLSVKNPQLQIIKLGDPCQQIFSFRGASQHFANETFHFKLSDTHRFGQAIASFCNQFMLSQDIGYYTPINSLHNNSTLHAPCSIRSLTDKVAQGFKPTILARHNMTLWYMLKQFATANIPCAFNGDTMHELKFLEDLYQLYQGNPVRHGRLKGKKYHRLAKLAKLEQDNQTILACRVVESIKEDGTTFFSRLKLCLVPKNKAKVLLSTVHQAKGLEFNHVIMMDDFTSCWDNKRKQFNVIEREEAHIIYTAITRAKHSLTPPKSWQISS